jgi:hypothetical protein
LIVQADGGSGNMLALVPQLILSILLIPLIGLFVGMWDRFRLLPIRDIG